MTLDNNSKILLHPQHEEEVAILALKGTGIDTMAVNSASLRRDGEGFVATADVYDGEIYTRNVTYIEVQEALEWDVI